MGGKDAPAPPDYRGAAEEQAQASRENLQMQNFANRPDQHTPFGSSEWETERVWDPTTETFVNRWEQNISLDPDLQRALEAQQSLQAGRSELAQGLLDRSEDEFGSPPDWSQYAELAATPGTRDIIPGYMDARHLEQERGDVPEALGMVEGSEIYRAPLRPGEQVYRPELNQYLASEQLQRGVDDPNAVRNRVEESLYNRGASRLDRRMSEEAESVESALRNQGLRPGDEAYDRAMQDFTEQRTDAYDQLQMSSILGAGEEAARQHGMNLGAGQFSNQAALAQFGMGRESADFTNQARRDTYGMEMDRAALTNAVRQAEFGMDMERAGMTNEARQAMFGQQATSAGLQDAQRQAELAEMLRIQGQNVQQNLAANEQNFSHEMGAANYQNQLRQQQIAEDMRRRGYSLNEINAILTGQQVSMPQMPGFNTAGRAETPQYLNAANMGYNASLDAFNAEQAALQGMMSGVGNVAGAFLPI